MRPSTAMLTSLAGASVVALGAYWLGQARAPQVRVQPPSPASATTIEESEDEASLADAVHHMNRRLAALELKQVLAQPAESDQPKTQRGALPQPMDLTAMRAKELERAAAIDGALKGEARDNVWAPSTESQLQTAVTTAVREAGAHFAVKSVRCMTSICEMVLSASRPEQLESTDLALVPHLTGMGSLDIAPPVSAADGSATVTYRLFRQGYPRPDEGT